MSVSLLQLSLSFLGKKLFYLSCCGCSIIVLCDVDIDRK